MTNVAYGCERIVRESYGKGVLISPETCHPPGWEAAWSGKSGR